MKRSGGSEGNKAVSNDGQTVDPVIDLTGENSQESDQEPHQKKLKIEKSNEKVKTAGASGSKINVSKKFGGKPGLSRQVERRKEFKARGFTPSNGFPAHPYSGGGGRWGGGWGAAEKKQRIAGQRVNEINRSLAHARPPSLMSVPVGSGGGEHDWGEGVFPGPDVFSHPSERFRMGFCPNPDDFHEVVERLSCPVDMQAAVTGAGQYSCLTREMVRCFNNNQQDMATMKQKILLWKEIYRAIHSEIDCGIFVFGSTFNGFGGSGCDIDMCIFPQGFSVGDKQWLTMARRILQKHCRHFIRGNIELINAKVPILKFFDREGRLEVDLSVNNPTSIRNTHLLYCYSQTDYRVRPLVLAVKMWAKDHKINEARFQTLSSYTLTLMVLHFLQCGVSPPVIPCLHRENPQMFNSNSDIFSLPYTSMNFSSTNRMSLGELLVRFFKYYNHGGDFDTQRDVGSIRCGSILDASDCERFARMNKLAPGQWSARLLMEEPFDRTNAARAVCNDEKWRVVKATLEATDSKIGRSNISGLTLEDLSARKIRLC